MPMYPSAQIKSCLTRLNLSARFGSIKVLELSLQISGCSRGTVTSSAALLVENIDSNSLLEIQDNNSISSSAFKGGGSLHKRLLFTTNYCDHEMCCFKREISAPKAWFPYSRNDRRITYVCDDDFKAAVISIANISCERSILATFWHRI